MLMYAHIPTVFDSILISLNKHHRDFWSLENVGFLLQPQICIIAMFSKAIYGIGYIQKRIAPFKMF